MWMFSWVFNELIIFKGRQNSHTHTHTETSRPDTVCTRRLFVCRDAHLNERRAVWKLEGQSRVYQVTRLRTDGVHRRESTGMGPGVLKVDRVTDAINASIYLGNSIDQITCACLFPHPLL